ncbi:unnamed protein product [Bursaphelenchus okinawaensis]|uniref:Protein FAM184A/B N-terminal domain-containing protein n=1 Tax=Bursaphelenchus okinawaensis TaxID=465554 RepID=A0A811KM43_9BILA|nr:unnamed protein product [Bursaphelenchus okinawaensis]CAG9105897.1 unnamed protein product [Bursaphelenchus okinawaensis]
MSEKLREKLGYLNSELDDIRHLRSLSPHSSQKSRTSRSPLPQKNDAGTGPSDPDDQTPTTPRTFDSRPDIAAWPAPPPAARVLSKPLNNKANQSNQTLTYRSQGTSPIPESQLARSPIPEETKLMSLLRSSANYSPSRGGRENELRKKIQNLEQTVAEYERQKFNVMGTFSEYREYVAERERTLEAEYSNKIIALSEDVLGAKKDFETRMKSFQALQEQFEQEKEQALENLKQEHQKEIEMLERRVAGSQLLNLEQKYIIEIRRLEDERKSLQTEKDRLGETFDTKLRRAQSLYETQLSAAKMLYVRELEALKDHEKHLKEELEARHEEFRDRVNELKLQSMQSREEVTACKTEMQLLQKKLKQKQNELEFIAKELENARSELRTSMRRLREVDAKLLKTTDELSERETELNKKAELLESAEFTKTRLESTVRKLQVEVKALKNKVDFLEIERDNLKCQSESQTHLQNTQIQALEAVLESVTKEKETSKVQYEKMLEQEREQAEQREHTLRKELCTKFNELEEQYNSLKDFVDGTETFRPDSAKLLQEIEVLRCQKNNLEDEVMELKDQLTEEKEKPDPEPSLSYVMKALRSVDNIRKHLNNDQAGPSNDDDEKILDVSVQVLKKELINEFTQSSTSRQVQLEVVIEKLEHIDKAVKTIVEEKNLAMCKVQKLEEENKQLALLIEQSSAVQSSRAALENSEMSLVKAKLENATYDLETERLKNKQLEQQLKHNEDLVEELSRKAKTLRAELQEQYHSNDHNLNRRLSDLQAELEMKEQEQHQQNEVIKKKKEELKQADAKNRVLKELLEYQHGSFDEVLDEMLRKVGHNAADISQAELHELFERYELVKRPEKEVKEEKPKPQVRECALQTNITVVNEPEETENQRVQSEIIQMLSEMMNGDFESLNDLLEMKEIIRHANEPSTSTGVYQKAQSKFSTLFHQFSDRGSKSSSKSKEDKPDISRSRSPSFLSRLRERTPSKARMIDTNLQSTSSMSSRYLDSDRSSSVRKKYSKDSGRPAWKF